MKKAIVAALDVTDFNGRKKEQATEKALGELNQLKEWKFIGMEVPPENGHKFLFQQQSKVVAR